MHTLRLGKDFSSKELLLASLGISFFIAAGVVHHKFQKPALVLTKQDTALNFNKDVLLLINAGNKRLITDILWIQTLLESDLEHYKKKDLNNWLFLRFEAISMLDPRFYENYLYGGIYLSVVKDDNKSASIIYDKGLTKFPNDYKLNYYSGVNYLELKNYANAVQLFEKIKDHPDSPKFMVSLITKLKKDSGTDLNSVFELVLYSYEHTQDPVIKNRLREDLYSIRAELDLECLNTNQMGCNRLDLEGNAYVERNGKYEAPRKFQKYGLRSARK